MPKRIIPIASGKGGVGKTTFAVHFALSLSRFAPTILVDLDTGTSSVRSSIGARIDKDLYHFHRKGAALSECVTRLDDSLDPTGRFRQFGFVAGPRHFIDEIGNPDAAFRRRLAEQINSLPADYVVLDLRAGLDANVLDFLPYTNSGILVLTPNLPQATLAASDVVKAILFRTLRYVFAEGSEVYSIAGFAEGRDLIHELLDKAEDVYDDAVPNLDSLVRELRELFGDQPLLSVVDWVISDFRVHYVLNMFNGVEASHEGAIVPFLRNLSENISTRLEVTQLGWVVQDGRIHGANCAGVPLLLGGTPEKAPADRVRPATIDPVLAEIDSLRSSLLGVHRARPARREPERVAVAVERSAPEAPPLDFLLGSQLDSLKAMFADRSKDSVEQNFLFAVYRALNLMEPPRLPTEFGMGRVAPPERLIAWILKRLALSASGARG